MVVSFLVVSAAIFILLVSFLVVSTTVVFDESTVVLLESVVDVEEEPLQAAKETATAKAKEAILIEFFIVLYFVFVALIRESKKGNPSFLKISNTKRRPCTVTLKHQFKKLLSLLFAGIFLSGVNGRFGCVFGFVG